MNAFKNMSTAVNAYALSLLGWLAVSLAGLLVGWLAGCLAGMAAPGGWVAVWLSWVAGLVGWLTGGLAARWRMEDRRGDEIIDRR